MANRETNVANVFSTTLASPMGGSDLTATVASTSGAPAAPCLLVVDADDDAKREVILFDGVFTGTTFVTSSLSNRYLDGSAAASGLTHDVGAKVESIPLAQHLIDVNDRVDLHDHTGGTQGVQVDHGTLLGRGDDDHEQYLNNTRHDTTARHPTAVLPTTLTLTDGTRAFTAPVGGVDATLASHLATKGQVDAVSAEVDVAEAASVPHAGFGASSQDGTTRTITSTSYVGVSGGVSHVATIRASGKALVIVSADIENGGNRAYFSFEMSGANTLVADDGRALMVNSGRLWASRIVLLSGLSAGSTTFSARYRVAGGTGTFLGSQITVLPL